MTSVNIEQARERLRDLRSRLLAELQGGEASGEAVELDQQRQGRLSRIDALAQQEMAKEATRRRRREIQRIDAALRRVEEDEYGDCLVCGEPIAPARLEIDPAASHCIRCAGRR